MKLQHHTHKELCQLADDPDERELLQLAAQRELRRRASHYAGLKTQLLYLAYAATTFTPDDPTLAHRVKAALKQLEKVKQC